MRNRCILPLIFLLCSAGFASAQEGYAIKGSVYSGVSAVLHNPASIVYCPYSWDINIMSLEYKGYGNAIRSAATMPLAFPISKSIETIPGNFKRRSDVDFMLGIMNVRIALNPRQAIAFGANLRGYGGLRTSRISYSDTIAYTADFLTQNERNGTMTGNAISSSWMEAFATYGFTVEDNSIDRINTAVTLKIQRGLSAGYARVGNLYVQKGPQESVGEDVLSGGNASIGYSSNYDGWSDRLSIWPNIKRFVKNSSTSFSFDLGMEYIRKTQAVGSIYNEVTPYDYDWKIGVALLDMGWNDFEHSKYSMAFSSLDEGLTGNNLTDKFLEVTDIKSFNDSLSGIVGNSRHLGGNFRVYNPGRLIVNADFNLGRDFYLNGDLSMDLSEVLHPHQMAVHSADIVTITPRWETRNLGLYLPVQYNRSRKVWMGMAFKAGPLLMGVHNVFNAFSKAKAINGGGFLSLLLHFSSHGRKKSTYYDCPVKM